MALETYIVSTPYGDAGCLLNGDDAIVEFKLMGDAGAGSVATASPAPQQIQAQLDEYFAGQRREFSLQLRPSGSDFQRRVWTELVQIPYGTTISYSELAERIGNPNAVRAVGGANGANPIWILIPCHRVIGADGSLTGYAGGMPMKRALLELEGAIPADDNARQGEINWQ